MNPILKKILSEGAHILTMVGISFLVLHYIKKFIGTCIELAFLKKQIKDADLREMYENKKIDEQIKREMREIERESIRTDELWEMKKHVKNMIKEELEKGDKK